MNDVWAPLLANSLNIGFAAVVAGWLIFRVIPATQEAHARERKEVREAFVQEMARHRSEVLGRLAGLEASRTEEIRALCAALGALVEEMRRGHGRRDDHA